MSNAFSLNPLKRFLLIFNKELFKTNQGFKIKSTVLTKSHTSPSQDLINQLNEAINGPWSGTVSSKYILWALWAFIFFPFELSIFFPFEYLFTYFSYWRTLNSHFRTHNLTFDIFGVNETKLSLNKALINSVIIPGYNFQFTAVVLVQLYL